MACMRERVFSRRCSNVASSASFRVARSGFGHCGIQEEGEASFFKCAQGSVSQSITASCEFVSQIAIIRLSLGIVNRAHQ